MASITSIQAATSQRSWDTTRRSSPSLPDAAVESFAGVANPFSLRPLQEGERVVDVGSGAGFRLVRGVAPCRTGRQGGRRRHDRRDARQGAIDSRACSGLDSRVPRRAGGAAPVEDAWADAVISNGVINLCADKRASSPRSIGCCGPVDGCNSPTSPTATRFRPRLSTMSIFGQLELPVVCRVQPGRRCWRKRGLQVSASAPRLTRSRVRAVKRTPADLRCSAMRSLRGSLNEMRAATGGIARDD